MVCPTNSYSQQLYDPRKETVLVLKQSEFYELVYLYEERNGKIHELKTFINKPTTLKNIIDILSLVQNTTNAYCKPLASQPRIYNFGRNKLASEIITILKSIQYEIINQIINYQGKIIGVLTKHLESAINIFIPCLPSAHLLAIPIKSWKMDLL